MSVNLNFCCFCVPYFGLLLGDDSDSVLNMKLSKFTYQKLFLDGKANHSLTKEEFENGQTKFWNKYKITLLDARLYTLGKMAGCATTIIFQITLIALRVLNPFFGALLTIPFALTFKHLFSQLTFYDNTLSQLLEPKWPKDRILRELPNEQNMNTYLILNEKLFP